jgi:choline dehydrogenase-like flavoprotein
LTIVNFSDRPKIPERDVCIIGAGPIGIALAMACQSAGLSVLVLESGGLVPDAASGALSRATISDPNAHAAMGVAVCRALGGTSHWWGGRCVQFDDVDFTPRRDLAGGQWPIAHEDIRPWYDSSASFLGCGSADFSRPDPRGRLDGKVDFDSVERWVPHPKLAEVYGGELRHSDKIEVVLGATVTKLQFSGQRDRIKSLVIADRSGRVSISVGICVVACGGLETTRLLLASQQEHAEAFGGRDGPLGRYYMGHISGKLADIVFDDPADVADYDFVMDGEVFLRRRFALKASALEQERLLNIAFWIDNPPFYDPKHKTGALSLAWLALATPILGKNLLPDATRLSHVGPYPRRFLSHAANLLNRPAATIATLAEILRDRYWRKPRKPGFLVRNGEGRYALHYHSQQIANPLSRVVLSDEFDALGLPRLRVDFKFSRDDADSVVRAHDVFDQGLRRTQTGHLEYRVEKAQRSDLVMQQASDGFHQMGTTRIGSSPADCVVDENCQVHGMDNLFVASTSVFPTSGQANPTFLGVAMAFRLGRFLSYRRHGQATNMPGEIVSQGSDHG